MENQKVLRIGLFGFGVVGEGLYKVLQQTPSLKTLIKKEMRQQRCLLPIKTTYY